MKKNICEMVMTYDKTKKLGIDILNTMAYTVFKAYITRKSLFFNGL